MLFFPLSQSVVSRRVVFILSCCFFHLLLLAFRGQNILKLWMRNGDRVSDWRKNSKLVGCCSCRSRRRRRRRCHRCSYAHSLNVMTSNYDKERDTNDTYTHSLTHAIKALHSGLHGGYTIKFENWYLPKTIWYYQLNKMLSYELWSPSSKM